MNKDVMETSIKEEESFQNMRNINFSSPHKLLSKIEALESKITRINSKTDYSPHKDLTPILYKLGLLYNKQGLICFQQNRPEKAEIYFIKAQNLVNDLNDYSNKPDFSLFLEINLIQNLGYLYKSLNKDELAYDQLSRFFMKNLKSDSLAMKPELITAGIEVIYIMFGGLCLKLKKIDIGLHAVLDGIQYSEHFLRNKQWLRMSYKNSQSLIEKKKTNLAYLYYLASKFSIAKKTFQVKNYENSLNFLQKGINLAKEVYGETSIQTLKYMKQHEMINKKLEFERNLISDLPENFDEFRKGLLNSNIETIRSPNDFLTIAIKMKSSFISHRTHHKSKDRFDYKKFPLQMGLHRRNLTTLSNTTATTPSYHRHQLSIISPTDITETTRNISDFMTKRPFCHKRLDLSKKPFKEPKPTPPINTCSTPQSKKTLTVQLSYKTLTSCSSKKSLQALQESSTKPSKIVTGQILKHSISLKKPDSTKKIKKERRFSERDPLTHEEKKGLSIFPNKVDGIEEENISIMGSVSEISESEKESPAHSSSKMKSSQQVSNTNEKENSINNDNSASIHQMMVSGRPALLKKQTLEIPFLMRSRSRGGGGSFEEKASSNSGIKEDDFPLEGMGEIPRIRTEIMDKPQALMEEMKSGERSVKESMNNEASTAAASKKFIAKVFKTLFLRKFHKVSEQKIKEIEEADSPIMKVIGEILPDEKPMRYSKFYYGDLVIDQEEIFPLKFYDNYGKIAEIMNLEIFLLRNHENGIIPITIGNVNLAIPWECTLEVKIVVKDANLNFVTFFAKKDIAEVNLDRIKGIQLAYSLLNLCQETQISAFTENKIILSILIENLLVQLKELKTTRRCTGKSLNMKGNNEERTREYIKYIKYKRNMIYKLAVQRDVSMKNYLKIRGFERIIKNPDVSHEFSVFYENFNEKLQKISNYKQIFSSNKKPSIIRRTASQNYFHMKSKKTPSFDKNSNSNTNVSPQENQQIDVIKTEEEEKQENNEKPEKMHIISKMKKKTEISLINQVSEQTLKKKNIQINQYEKQQITATNQINLIKEISENERKSYDKKDNGLNIITNEKKSSSKTMSFSSSPLIKEKDVISSIKEIPITQSQSNSNSSFFSKRGPKRMETFVHSTSFKTSEMNVLRSSKELNQIQMNLDSFPEFSDPQTSLDRIHLLKERSPRRKTMQYYHKTHDIPTIQSLFDLEGIEGSPHKGVSQTHGFENFSLKPLMKASPAGDIKASPTGDMSSRNNKTELLLCNNKEFVEKFFNKINSSYEGPSRYQRLRYVLYRATGIFVEKPYIFFDDTRNNLIHIDRHEETMVVMVLKSMNSMRNLININVIYKENIENWKDYWDIDNYNEISKLAEFCYIRINFVDNREKNALEIPFIEFFSEALNLGESNEEAFDIYKHYIEYKTLRKGIYMRIIEFLKERLDIEENNGKLVFFEYPKKKHKKMRKIKEISYVMKESFAFFKENSSVLGKTVVNEKKSGYRKYYLKFHLRNSAKYLRIEVFWYLKIMKLAFYDPLQGKKDYCLINSQQKAEFHNIERVIKEKSLGLKERIFSQNLTYIQELVGKKLYIFREIRKNDEELKQKNYQKNIKLVLISNVEDDNLRNFFIKRILYEVYKIRNLGKSYIKITIYKPNRHYSIEFQNEDQSLYKLEIYPFNKRFSLQKFIFTNEDFPLKTIPTHERAVLTYLNQEVLNKLSLIKSMLYKRLVVPKTFSDNLHKSAYFVEEMKFDKNSEKESKKNLIENDAKFLQISCISYKITFQCIKKLGGLFTIITIKKHVILGYWVIELYFPSSNRNFKTFLKGFDYGFKEFEIAQSVKIWNILLKNLKLVKNTSDSVLLIMNAYRGIIRESLFEEIIVNKDCGLVLTEWFIENIITDNCLKYVNSFEMRNSQDFRVFIRITFLTQGLIFNEKICLRDLIYSNIEFKALKSYKQGDLLRIIRFYAMKLKKNIKNSFDLRFFKEKAFKTRFVIEDPTLKPVIRLTKDQRIEGFFDKKYKILLVKVLSLKPKEVIGVLWIVKKKEFLIVVLKNSSCREVVWKATLEEIKEKINFVENMMK